MTLIKYLLNGKTIDLTGDNIVIKSDNFSVDETGKVTATSGEIGGFTTTANEFSSELYSSYAYSRTDLDKIRDYILEEITLTEEEIELYDVDKNGIIDAVDYMMINNYIATGTSAETPGEVKWTNGDVFNTFTIKNGTGERIVGLNAFRSYIKYLDANIISLNGKSISENRILWEGSHYMNGTQSANLSELVSEQKTGIVLVWSAYDTTNSVALDSNFTFVYVPKAWIELTDGGGYGVTSHISGTNFSNMACKYVYVADDHITGNDSNIASGTTNGITYDNRNAVLRYVLGV